MESVWSVSKLWTSVGSRRELVANSVHTADADATQQAPAVCIGLYGILRCSYYVSICVIIQCIKRVVFSISKSKRCAYLSPCSRVSAVEYSRRLLHCIAACSSVELRHRHFSMVPHQPLLHASFRRFTEQTRSSAIAGRPCDAKACQGLLK